MGDLEGEGVDDLEVGVYRDGNFTAGFEVTGAVYILLMDSDRTVKSNTKIAGGMNGFFPANLEDGDDFGQRQRTGTSAYDEVFGA